MSAGEPQVVDSEEFIDLIDYQFSGDNDTVTKKRAVIAAYREYGSILHAFRVAGLGSRKTVYRWLETDPAFSEALADCKEDCNDKVESSVFMKAVNGSTLDAIFYLKAKRPEFRDRLQVDVDSVKHEIRDYLGELRQLPPTTTTIAENLATPSPVHLEQKEQD